ncbi:unnamed protein product [Cylicocyclus nassatus]|uniref:Uncharacterized protein n=1 Tax=Cylicocyclus nassatus TaxID=53992 RepID=A0AA36GQ87_CYLNA|nr:unnamed protein product [Cylicocyclus nassatus]
MVFGGGANLPVAIRMLDSLRGKQQSSPWFDSLSTSLIAMNINSSVLFGSPLGLSSRFRASSDALSHPTWLFSSQLLAYARKE